MKRPITDKTVADTKPYETPKPEVNNPSGITNNDKQEVGKVGGHSSDVFAYGGFSFDDFK